MPTDEKGRVRVELRASVTPGLLRLRTKVTGAKGANALGATGRHIIFEKGGNGVDPRGKE